MTFLLDRVFARWRKPTTRRESIFNALSAQTTDGTHLKWGAISHIAHEHGVSRAYVAKLASQLGYRTKKVQP